MASSSQTRGQIDARYKRLLKRIEIVKVSDPISKALVLVAKETLDMFPVTGPNTSSSLPNWNEVESFMRSLSPSPSEVYTEEFFKKPLFPVVTLCDVAKFYGCPSVEKLLDEVPSLSHKDKINMTLITHVWFAQFLDCDMDSIVKIVHACKASRSLPNIAHPATPITMFTSNHQTDASSNVQASVSNVQEKFGKHEQDNVNLRKEVKYTPTHDAPNVHDRPQPVKVTINHDSGTIDVQEMNDSRKASSVFQYFKDSKFTGDIRQSIELTLRDYNVCARQHNLTLKQKADFFVNIPADPARTFFFNHARDDMTFDEMAQMMVGEYNSDARQLQVQGILENLRLEKCMAENEIASQSEGLSKLVDMIERLTPQCQSQFRSDANKINFLRKAVIGFKWAMTPIGNIITAKYTFNGFVTALREHLQLDNELSSTSSWHGVRQGPREGTFFQRYGRNPKHVRKHSAIDTRSGHGPAQDLKLSFEESRRRNLCRKCKKKWTPGHKCKPGEVQAYVRDQFQRGQSAVHIVSELVQALENEALDLQIDSKLTAEEDQNTEESIHFGQVHEELSLFDLLMSAKGSTNNHDLDEDDKEWFTNHLSASFAESESPLPHQLGQDF